MRTEITMLEDNIDELLELYAAWTKRSRHPRNQRSLRRSWRQEMRYRLGA
jgi:siroheme synthase (precorrin-2 oxidase/ferrochelatase)